MRRRRFQNENGEWVDCELIRQGLSNSRVKLETGGTILVPTESLIAVDEGKRSRLVPKVPLEYFYRKARDFTGSKQEKFAKLQSLISDGNGPRGHEFLSELFTRSVRHGESYSNVNEHFYSDREESENNEPLPSKFARLLVRKLDAMKSMVIGGENYHFVDYEVFPFRTKLSCTELGESAARSGSGGMDLLLAEGEKDGIKIPTIGEVKAKTETVGPTFALVQALMYASQIATSSQFERLGTHYNHLFSGIDCQNPRVNVLIILEGAEEDLNQEDFAYASGIAKSLQESLRVNINSIRFAVCEINDGRIEARWHGNDKAS